MLNRSDLYGYQRHAVDFIKSNRNANLWVDMGLGKTVSTLTAYNDLRESFNARKMLVIAPKRVARKVWSDEVQTWSHLNHLRISRIVGDVDQCFRALKAPADVYTIGRDRVQWLHAQFVQDGKLAVEWPFDIVAGDEFQSFASWKSQRTKLLYDLRRLARWPRQIGLSGTPMPNGYGNLWSQYRILDNGKRLGTSENGYKQRFFTPPVGIFQNWTLRPFAEEQILKRIADITLVLREEDYLDLPPVVDNFIRCELSASAMAVYKRFEREYITEVAGKKLTAVNAGVLDGKLLQLSNGACYTGQDKEWVNFHDEKLEALEETLEGIGGKVLVAYSFNHDKARISRVLDSFCKSNGRSWRLLDSDRDFGDWADRKIDIGLLHPASAGHGLNDIYKAGALDLIFFGLTNNLEWYQQVRARLTGGHRRAKRHIRVHHIVAEGTRDDDYVALIKRKALTQDNAKGTLAVKLGRAA